MWFKTGLWFRNKLVTQNQIIRWLLKPAIFVAALVPFGRLVSAGYTGNLGADPLNEITITTGLWALRFLCIALAVTPLRRLTGSNSLVRFRRMLGLFAFFYGSVHLLIYVVADRMAGLDYPNGIVAWTTVTGLATSVGADVFKRPFITIGFTAWLCMLPLALTSTAGMIRRLGGRRWQALHRLVYAAATAGVVHYWCGVKADIRPPLMYAVIVGVLLAFRLVWARMHAPAAVRKRSASPAIRATLEPGAGAGTRES